MLNKWKADDLNALFNFFTITLSNNIYKSEYFIKIAWVEARQPPKVCQSVQKPWSS